MVPCNFEYFGEPQECDISQNHCNIWYQHSWLYCSIGLYSNHAFNGLIGICITIVLIPISKLWLAYCCKIIVN